jgi:hypothetical protein
VGFGYAFYSDVTPADDVFVRDWPDSAALVGKLRQELGRADLALVEGAHGALMLHLQAVADGR